MIRPEKNLNIKSRIVDVLCVLSWLHDAQSGE